MGSVKTSEGVSKHVFLQEVKSAGRLREAVIPNTTVAVSISVYAGTVTGHVAVTLTPLTTYRVIVERGAIEDMFGNSFGGLNRSHTFTTGLGHLKPTAWRVLATGRPKNPKSQGLGGWHVAELEIYSGTHCLARRLNGTPSSSLADAGFVPSLPTEVSAPISSNRSNTYTCGY
jgi:hypothetical protein